MIQSILLRYYGGDFGDGAAAGMFGGALIAIVFVAILIGLIPQILYMLTFFKFFRSNWWFSLLDYLLGKNCRL